VLIETRPALDPELAALVTAQQREMRDTAEFVPDDDATSYLVAVVGGRAVGCGVWRRLTAGLVEIKRMYVRPAFRGRGIARQLIVAIEEEALAAGRPVVRLETVRPAAIALFQSSGYRQVPGRGCFEKRLGALVQ
jgi:putative acetyltransferase